MSNVLYLRSVCLKKCYKLATMHVKFDLISLTDSMLYHGNIVLLVLLLKSQVTEGSGYNCSDINGQSPFDPLVECPPAKFMLIDNLVECFDNFTRNQLFDSRKDDLRFFSVQNLTLNPFGFTFLW